MKRLICFFAAALFSVTVLSAQDYNWAVGVRGGGEMSGLSVKHKFNASSAIEGILSMPYSSGFVVTGIYERHIPVIDDGFNFYYGAGAHVGKWRHRFALGADGIIGLEYILPTIPLGFSVDYKPVFNIIEKTKFYFLDFALGVKVLF